MTNGTIRVCGKGDGLPCRMLNGHVGPCESRPKLRVIPDYGTHMTMAEFIDHVRSGGFIDYDGYASYATETHIVNGQYVYPSDVLSGNYDSSATHVVWYNK